MVGFTPEEILEESKEFSRQPDNERLGDATIITGEWADFWEEHLSSSGQFDGETWRAVVAAADKQRKRIAHDIETEYEGDEWILLRKELRRINWVLGEIPRYISAHDQSDLEREEEREGRVFSHEEQQKRQKRRHFLAKWQGEAVFAIGRLDEEAIARGENGSDLIHDWFLTICEKRRIVREPREAVGVSLAGVFGCLAVADIAIQAGYKVCLPPYQWDADNSVDLLLYRPGGSFPPTKVYPVQVKYRSGGERELCVLHESSFKQAFQEHQSRWPERDMINTPNPGSRPSDPFYSEVGKVDKFFWKMGQLKEMPGWETIDIKPLFVYLTGEGWDKASFRRALSGELGAVYADEFQRSAEGREEDEKNR